MGSWEVEVLEFGLLLRKFNLSLLKGIIGDI